MEEIVLESRLEAANLEIAGEASSKIKRVLQQIGIRSDIVRRIAIASYEAEMNVIIHSLGGSIKACISPEQTRIFIDDDGPGIPDINLAMQEGYSTAPDHIREMGFGAGMGLPNMLRCADEFDIRSEVGKGTNISMIIRHN